MGQFKIAVGKWMMMSLIKIGNVWDRTEFEEESNRV